MNNDINEKIVHAAPVPPFVRFVASAVPMVFDNSLSYYECLCALWKWMQDNLVDVINNNATVTEHYIEMDEETRQLFTELKNYVDNYFDNLDVQEEINNKLDDMVEAGTLQEIITTYIQSNVTWTFDTVAEMKSATNLVAGSFARTLGYHALDDKGGATYYISSTGTADEGSIIALSGDLKAHLIVTDYITPEQFGAYGNNSNDDTEGFRKALNYGTKRHIKLLNDNYIISSDLPLNSHTVFDLNGATIKTDGGSAPTTDTNYVSFKNNYDSMSHIGYGAISDITFKNGILDGNGGGMSFLLFHADDCEFDNLEFRNCMVNTHVFDLGGCTDIRIKNCKFIGNLLSDSSIKYREVIQPDYATSSGMPYWGSNPDYDFDNAPTKGLLVENCSFSKNAGDTYYLNGVGTHTSLDAPLEDITIKGCEFDGCEYANIRLPRVKYLNIEGCTFTSRNVGLTGDYFLIDLRGNTDTASTEPSSEINVKNNKFLLPSGVTPDHLSLGIGGPTTTYLMKNIVISGNEFHANFTQYSDGYGVYASWIRNLQNILYENNVFYNCRAALIKTANDVVNYLTFVNNTLFDCFYVIAATGNISNENNTNNTLVVANNNWHSQYGNGNLSAGSIIGKGTLSSNSNVNSNGTDTLVPISTVSSTLFGKDGNHVKVPTLIRNFKVGGKINLTCASGSTLNYISVVIKDRDRSNNIISTNKININREISKLETIDLGTLTFIDDSFVSDKFYGDNDGRFIVGVLINATTSVSVKSEGTELTVTSI